MSLRSRASALIGLSVAVTGVVSFVPSAAYADPAGTGLVISEVYGAGGNGGAVFNRDFVELYNPASSAVSVAGMSVQYRSSNGTSPQVTALSGTIAAQGYYLVGMSQGTVGADLPTPDVNGGTAMSGTSGVVLLVGTTTGVTTQGDFAQGAPNRPASVIDTVGYGTSATTFETTNSAVNLTSTTSAQRSVTGADTDQNAPDLFEDTPTPKAGSVDDGGGEDPGTPGEVRTIAEIQGTGATSPLTGTVTTQGVVTASYPTGGLNGFFLQTPGSPATPDASDGIFVYGGSAGLSTYPAVGDSVSVTGTVGEFSGATQLTTSSANITPLATSLGVVTPKTEVPGTDCTLPGTACLSGAELDAAREKVEGELFAPAADYTVTDSYDGSPAPSTLSTFQGEIGLAAGSDVPLVAPTEVIDAQDGPAIAERDAYNLAHRIILDDGSALNYTSADNRDKPLPYFTQDHTVRVGAAVTFPKPVVLNYGFGTWRLIPQAQVVGDSTGTVDIEQDRPAAPEEVGGAIKLATFNVLNYFPTTGADYEAAGLGTCTYYTDRAGNRITVNSCSGGEGPRGAADRANLARQQDKIVHAIDGLGASVVSLEEIENSVKFGKDRDFALSTLVDALNADAGAGTWAFAPSPAAADLPALAEQDVIRTAFIYQPAEVSLVGASRVLTGSPAFGNAREPLAQGFKLANAADSDAFGVIVNHFKSKGSGTPDPDGQGNATDDRIAQARALKTFAADVAAGLGDDTALFLTGDFNAYSMEDPIQVLEEDGDYVNLDSTTDPAEESYNFGGLVGSLDHVLANPAAAALVTGVDVWNINADESVYYEYSRFNYNVTNLYDTSPFRASDHNPEIVGLDPANSPVDPAGTVDLNLLNINDFHGRIDANTTKFATTVEQLRQAGGEDNTLFLSAGDNIGASLFASSVQQDEPTIDVLNALGLNASAIGNHELDKGADDLRGRVQDRADWSYLAANIYTQGTQTPAFDEYDVIDVDGVRVGIIGAITQETPSLVSPGGIGGLDFGDPVDAVNRVAAQLSDGDEANGEADVLVAEFHEGAGESLESDSTCEQEVAAGGVFAKIANQTSAQVDAIFTGHTHKVYACDLPVPGEDGRTRPVLQTGSYGENVGQVVLSVDGQTGDVQSYTQRNVARAAAEDLSLPRVQQVKQITDAALAEAARIGNEPVGTITADITTAYSGTSRDNRSAESTLGDLVADALRDGVSDFAQPDLGVTNPGGLRAELLYAGDTTANPKNTDGVVTFAEANAVLPFNNTVAIVKLTGAQLKTVLEQQFQTNADGTVPSRPYLQLGLSDNVRVTADATAAAGSRITSVYIDDVALDPAKTYTVSTLSFLAQGGDNFRAFTQGTSVDTGLLDAELFRNYLGAETRSPDFARQMVFATDLPSVITVGEQSTFTLGPDLMVPVQPNTGETLDLTSLGSPANTQVVATVGGTVVGTFPVTNGTAAIDLTVPASAPADDFVTFVAQPSGTTVTVPLQAGTGPALIETSTRANSNTDPVIIDKTRAKLVVVVRAVGRETPTGQVRVDIEGQESQLADLVDGKAIIRLGRFSELGPKAVAARYLGSDTFAPSSGLTTVTVVAR